MNEPLPRTAFDHSELGAIDTIETAARLRTGELEAEEVITAAIARSQTLGPILNAIPAETYDSALERARGPIQGPFAGVPTFLKALDDQKGVSTDFGSAAWRGRVGRRTEPFLTHMLDTGLIRLGTSATPEAGLSATTEPLAHGPTRNPWNLVHTPGGSSGGAAALVAARVVPIAHGSDAGGSIRIPSSACGLVGLKVGRERRFASTSLSAPPWRARRPSSAT
jgi:amidase